MAELNSEIAAALVEACTANADEAAGALSRALDGSFAVKVGEAVAYDAAPTGFDGAGLMFLFRAGEVGMAVALPAAAGLVPQWCAAPDATGESKLATLAQELSMLLVPDSLTVDEFKARQLDNLAAAIERGKVGEGATVATLEVTSGEQTGQLSLIWPLAAPGELFAAASASTGTPPAAKPQAAKMPAPQQRRGLRGLESLPRYSQSLLKIQVPVSVQLAAKKEVVQEVITLAPGSIIKFEKGCEELLQMIVGEHTIAEGEAVKIGDKFGFRVTSMVMPPEHFVTAKKAKSA